MASIPPPSHHHHHHALPPPLPEWSSYVSALERPEEQLRHVISYRTGRPWACNANILVIAHTNTSSSDRATTAAPGGGVAFHLLPPMTMMTMMTMSDAQQPQRVATSMELNIPGDVLRAATSGLITNINPVDEVNHHHDHHHHHRLFKVALFANKQILVYACNATTSTTATTITTATTSTAAAMECIAVVQMSSARLVYWIFITADIILLLTTHAGYTLKVRRVATVVHTDDDNDVSQKSSGPKPDPISSGSKPIKIFDRIDLPPYDDYVDDRDGNGNGGDDDLVKDVVVSDVQVFQDGWTMVTSSSSNSNSPLSSSTSSSSSSSSTASSSSSSSSSSTSHSRTNSTIISLYQAKSGRAISFHAICGSFRLGLQQQGQVALVVPAADNEHYCCGGFTVVLMDLDAIHKYWQSNSNSNPIATTTTTTTTTTDGSSSAGIQSQKKKTKKYWVDPLHLTDPNLALTLQASLTVSSADCFEGDDDDAIHRHRSSYIWCLRNSLFMLTSKGVLYQINSNTNPLTKERLRLLGHASILPIHHRTPLHSSDESPEEGGAVGGGGGGGGGGGRLGSTETAAYAVVGASMSLQDPSKPSIRFILYPTGDVVEVSLKSFSNSISIIAQGLV